MKTRQSFLPMALAALSALATGCATVLTGPNQRIEVVTDPPGATVSVGDLAIVSPGVLELPRAARALVVTIELEGYQTKFVPLIRRTNDAVWLDALDIPAAIATAGRGGFGDSGVDFSGGPLAPMRELTPGWGFTVDYSSGAAYRLEPGRIVVTLEPASLASVPSRGGP